MTRDHPWLDGPLPAGRGEWVREIEALMREVGLEGEIPPPSAWTPRVLMPPCSECGRTACTLIDSRLEVYAARIRELVAERDEARADMVNADYRAVNSDLHRKRADEALARVRELEEALRKIEDYYAGEWREGDKAFQAVIVARAALTPEEPKP